MSKKNKNFEHINYDINHNTKTIAKYEKTQKAKQTLVDPETKEQLEYRQKFEYQIGDYAWYIPEPLEDGMHPFMLIRCVIVDVCNAGAAEVEYILDEPIKHSVHAGQLYPDVSFGFAELRRIFYHEIAKYSMLDMPAYNIDDDLLDDKITYEHFKYEYSNLRAWRYRINGNKKVEDSILSIKKERLIDWYNIHDFFEFNLMYYDT